MNERLAKLIDKFDCSGWHYNHYCRDCGRFIYHDRNNCKCGTSIVNTIKHPIPFNTSGTAFEKLLNWIKRFENEKLIAEIKYYFDLWIQSKLSDKKYHILIIRLIINYLENKDALH